MEVKNQMKVTDHIKDIITKNIIKADEIVCLLDGENFSSFLCQISSYESFITHEVMNDSDDFNIKYIRSNIPL